MLKIDKSGIKALRKQINTLELEVGFFEESVYPDGIQVAQVAQWNNEGQPANNIPPRPFFTTSLLAPIEMKKKNKMFTASLDRIFKGKSTFLQEYTFIGKQLVQEVKQSIRDWDTPPNSPTTIAMKGFNDPLVNTTQMLDSVDFKIERG